MVLKIFATFIFLADLRLTDCQILESIEKEFPDINEMFSSFSTPAETKFLNIPPNTIVRNISIDLERINVQKFRRKLDSFKSKFAEFERIGNWSAKFTEFDKIRNWTDVSNDTRRLPYHGSSYEWGKATEHVVKTKCLDMMLQLIYMARHKIRQLESEKYFNRHDTSYRIAFLYRRLRRIWKKMLDIISTMKKRQEDWYGPYSLPKTYLVLHHKAAILHVDFVYMWWVLVNLHSKYNIRHLIPNTTPHDK